jgi:hypothetical protein
MSLCGSPVVTCGRIEMAGNKLPLFGIGIGTAGVVMVVYGIGR